MLFTLQSACTRITSHIAHTPHCPLRIRPVVIISVNCFRSPPPRSPAPRHSEHVGRETFSSFRGPQPHAQTESRDRDTNGCPGQLDLTCLSGSKTNGGAPKPQRNYLYAAPGLPRNRKKWARVRLCHQFE